MEFACADRDLICVYVPCGIRKLPSSFVLKTQKYFLKHKSCEFLVGILGITEVIGSITGTINRKDIGSVALMAEISYVDQFVVIKLDVKNIPKPLLYIMRSVVSFLVPVYWSVVNQGEDGFNGISIALGKFTYNGKVFDAICFDLYFHSGFHFYCNWSL